MITTHLKFDSHEICMSTSLLPDPSNVEISRSKSRTDELLTQLRGRPMMIGWATAAGAATVGWCYALGRAVWNVVWWFF